MQANELLEAGLDLAIVGRMFQKNPGLVFTFADELGVEVQMPNQIRWGVSCSSSGLVLTTVMLTLWAVVWRQGQKGANTEGGGCEEVEGVQGMGLATKSVRDLG